MNCKQCGGSLTENSPVCSFCGAVNEQAAKMTKTSAWGMKPMQRSGCANAPQDDGEAAAGCQGCMMKDNCPAGHGLVKSGNDSKYALFLMGIAAVAIVVTLLGKGLFTFLAG